MKPGLFVRLMGAFAVVSTVGILVVAVITNQTTTSGFRQFMFRGEMVQGADFAAELSEYYGEHGGWSGVEQLLARSGGMMNRGQMRGGGMAGMSSQVLLADAQGVIVADSNRQEIGMPLDPNRIASGIPIVVDGQTVGTLVIAGSPAGMMVDAPAEEFLAHVNRSLALAAVVAVGIALGLGFLVFRQTTAPLSTLAQAFDRIAAGDMTVRAQVAGNDEIAHMARSFNAMADKLASSETARRNMLADIAHELRNPIGIISSHLEAMIDGVFPADAKELGSLQEETQLLARLVGDVRELALADAGQLELNRKPTDMYAMVERTAAAFQPQAFESDITLVTELSRVPTLNVDGQRIEQSLMNLLSNALFYTPAQGSVTVALAQDVNEVWIEVRDTGPGIAPEALPHVFERFWRADKARARSQGGTGLGLPIAKQWVEAHGGRIGATSELGRGSSFRITLPKQ